MRKLWLLLVFLIPLSASATTKLRFHNSPSSIAGYKAMDISLGPPQIAQVTSVTNATASGTDIQLTKTAGGAALAWISEPLAAGFTLSGTVTGNPYGKESATSVNASFRLRLYQYTGGAEGSEIAVCQATAELTASITVKGCTTTPTSTVFATGDRIVAKLFLENCSATSGCPTGTMAAGTVTMDYDGPTDAADGSSWVQLNETVTFTPDGGSGGTPDVVGVWTPPNMNNSGQSLGAGVDITAYYPHPGGTIAGNMGLVTLWYTTGTGWSVTDDQGNVYTLGPTVTQNGYTEATFYAVNLAAGTRVVTIHHTTGTVIFLGPIVTEVKNIATSSAYDGGACTGDSSGSPVTSGSFTTLSNGDFIYHHFFAQTASSIASIAAGSGFNLLAVDNISGQAAQYGVQTTAGAINPSMTVGTISNDWGSCGMAFKSSTAGGSHTGLYVRGIQTIGYPATITSPVVIQWPTACGLQVDLHSAGGTDAITGITSSPNTWSQVGSQTSFDGADVIGITDIWKAVNATPSLGMSISIALNQTATSDNNHMLMDICGASTTQANSNVIYARGTKTGVTPIDTATGGMDGGTVCNGGTVACSLTITPAASDSLVLGLAQVAFNTINATSTSGCVILNGFLGTNTTGNTPYFENNGWMACLNHAASPIAMSWTLQSGLGANTAYWSNIATEFLAPATSTTRKRVVIVQ